MAWSWIGMALAFGLTHAFLLPRLPELLVPADRVTRLALDEQERLLELRLMVTPSGPKWYLYSVAVGLTWQPLLALGGALLIVVALARKVTCEGCGYYDYVVPAPWPRHLTRGWQAIPSWWTRGRLAICPACQGSR